MENLLENEVERHIVDKKDINLIHKVLKVKLDKKKFKVYFLAYIVNNSEYEIEDMKVHFSELSKDLELNVFKSKMNKYEMVLKNKLQIFELPMSEIIEHNIEVNNSLKITLTVNGQELNYNLCMKNKKIKNKKFYYVPLKSIYYDKFSVAIRRTAKGNLVLNKRLKEDIENEKVFKFYESKFVSRLMYWTGKIFKKISPRKVNIYYEKFSSKAEEGVFELCERVQDSKKSKNYFIIDSNSEDYKRIANNKFVVPKYSFKYYWVVYRANNIISTEAPMHISILRSNNKFLRRSVYEKANVFLQHGIIFMKNLGKNSAFIKGKEAEPTYMVVSSNKEADVVENMLHIEKERLWVTGLAIFDKIGYNHIVGKSNNTVTVMLTWKPYEEHLYNFEESSYYKNVVEVYNMLSKYIPNKKINIIPHPKVLSLLSTTQLKNSIWQGPISEVLNKTKLLITDYSSICYNSFYQGSGVIFYQPDLELYEEKTGELIPRATEYIGHRIFNIDDLEKIIKENVVKGRIDLRKFRTKEHEEIYSKINEFNDSKNTERIYKKLLEINIV